MSTVVAFHAHPDDESLIMGGSLARASAEDTGSYSLLPLMVITDKFLMTLRQERR